jgi:hypothetical protein
MITVSTSLYRRTMMREPNKKVVGNWWFSIGSTEGYNDIEKAWSPNGHYKYSEAVKLAKAQAKKQGATIIYVLP